ncbi:hypothetical protein JOD43_002334 [Pullulanibacillus pueri]|uniref:DUF370 domain-containing protein n=1 Tax=Pullulanibacillus pueri TaxID=1437324 RepID=A0A8J2ZVD6_9BACL|nr:extracellular matrix/biofilm biosynthesis regulator RemA family protein [Pullulanibacillus pueri]MBM7682161.1 hypothetical protein [Pullulanibacillus pueri]GGH80270.1 hypothetical protein GCM10007096_16420 [Pullulanibacillus pueri]
MFINLGEDTIIRTDEVIAIFDYDLFRNDANNQQFIKTSLENKEFTEVGQQLTKAVVLTNDSIYYSPFSPATLKKRSQNSINSP